MLTPRVSSLWLALVTPPYARVGRKLIDSIRYDTVVESDSAARLFPGIRPMGVRAAIERAIANEDLAHAETRWSDAVSSAGAEAPGPPDRPGGRGRSPRRQPASAADFVPRSHPPAFKPGGSSGG